MPGVDPAARPSSRLRSAGYRLLAVGVGIVLALGVAEIALRVLGIRAPEVRTKTYLVGEGRHFHCYASNPNGEFRPVPAVDTGQWKLYDYMLPPDRLSLDRLAETPWCVEYKTSPQGLRDRLYAPRPEVGTLRILGMGDSFAMGEGVPLERSLFKQIEQQVGPGIEVVNAARAGLALHEEVDLLEKYVRVLHAERVILVVIPNDVAQSEALRTRQDYINDLINVRDHYLAAHEQARWYTGFSRVVEVIGSHLERRRIARATVDWYRDLYDPRQNGANLRAMARDFERVAALPGCRSVVVVYPLMVDLGDAYPLRDVHRTLVDLAEAAGLPTLDLEPVFRDADTQAMQVHPSDHHPNGRAHARAAAAIVQWLRETQPGFLPDADDR